MNDNKFLLLGNSTYENRGCEAIVRGTIEVLDRTYGSDNKYILETLFDNDNIYQNQKSNEYDERIKHLKWEQDKGRLKNNLTIKSIIEKILFTQGIYGYPLNIEKKQKAHEDLLDDLKDCQAALSVGGDNYTLDYGAIPYDTISIDDVVLHYNKPCILWGATVGPFTKIPKLEKYMKKHLKLLTAIFAREDKTVEYLNSIGIIDNVYRVSDPAFLMKPIKPSDADNISNLKGSIGINLSPLMARYWANGDLNKWTAFCIELVKKISDSTEKPVFLLPHVMHEGWNNDYNLLKTIKESQELVNKENIQLIGPNYSAAQYKYLISQMDGFIGARTHATIAAFSTLVPTLSLAYSTKAFGINQEVYNDLSFCISNDKSDNVDYIVDVFKSLLQDKDQIKTTMENNLSKIEQRSAEAGNIIKRLI